MPDGREVRLFRFLCSDGMTISITNYGGIITSIKVPDKNEAVEEITAGFPAFSDYLKPNPHFGAIIGRFAGRIAKGRFEINRKAFQLNMNYEHFQLHGGVNGFDKKLWDYTLEEKPGEAILRLGLLSADNEEGYPGNLSVAVSYTIRDNNSLELRLKATTDKPTHVNLTNHAYFNLGGFKGDIADHHLMLHATHYLELDQFQIPTGVLLSCSETLFDFSRPVKLSDKGIPGKVELDNCFVLNKNPEKKMPDATLYHPDSGRILNIFTTQPGVQIYTANHLNGSLTGHGGIAYKKHSAICLETQHFPDSPNQREFISSLLLPGQTYCHHVIYEFGIKL